MAHLDPFPERSLFAVTTARDDEPIESLAGDYNLIQKKVRDVLFVITVTADKDFRFASVNRRFLEVAGLAENQVIGHRVADIIPSPTREFVLERYREAVRIGEPVSWEETSDDHAGHKFGVVTLVPVLDPARNCTHLIGSVHDLTERKQAEEHTRIVSEQRRALAVHLQFVREEERAAIAREIHDVLAQDLTRLKMDLAWIAQRLGRPIPLAMRPEAIARAAEALTHADSCMAAVQKIATELRPVILDQLGLAAAVEWLVEDFGRRTGIGCRVRIDAGMPAIETGRATAVFRILQESLTNIVRYARASAVQVELLAQAESLSLIIADNGVGITAAQADNPWSIGLVGMRERAMAFGGSVQFSGIPGKGTTVSVEIPTDAS